MKKDADATPLMDRYRECVRHLWNCYFSEDPVNRIEPDALDLRFLQYFDWWALGFRDLAYYRVRILGSKPHPHLIGRDALLPVGPGVKVIYDAVG